MPLKGIDPLLQAIDPLLHAHDSSELHAEEPDQELHLARRLHARRTSGAEHRVEVRVRKVPGVQRAVQARLRHRAVALELR